MSLLTSRTDETAEYHNIAAHGFFLLPAAVETSSQEKHNNNAQKPSHEKCAKLAARAYLKARKAHNKHKRSKHDIEEKVRNRNRKHAEEEANGKGKFHHKHCKHHRHKEVEEKTWKDQLSNQGCL